MQLAEILIFSGIDTSYQFQNVTSVCAALTVEIALFGDRNGVQNVATSGRPSPSHNATNFRH